MWPFGRSKESVVVRQWAAAISDGKIIAIFRVRKAATGYTMTQEGSDGQEQPFSASVKGHYSTIALAYEAMIEFCASLVYVVLASSILGVNAEILEPRVLHITEVLPDMSRAIPMAQIMIDGFDLVRGDYADPTTREPINPPRATILTTERPQ